MLRVFKYQDRYEVLLAYFSLFLLSLNNTLVSYTIGGISIDRLLEIITFFLILPFIKKDFFSGKALSFVSIFILCFVALRTLSLIFEVSAGATDLETLAREIVRVVIFLIFFALAYFGIKKLGIKGVIFFLIITAPYVLLALSQHPLMPFNDISYSIYELLYIDNLPKESYCFNCSALDQGFIYRVYTTQHFLIRPIGPYTSPIALSYALIPVMGMTLYAYLQEEKIRYYFWFLFMLLVAVLTLTRSLIMGSALIFITILCLQFFFNRNRWTLPINGLLFLGFFFYLLSEPEYFSRIFSIADVLSSSGYSGRLVAWISGFIALIENPLYYSSETYRDIYISFCHRSDACTKVISMHNGFLRVGRDFTIFGIFLYFTFFGYLFFKAFHLDRPLSFVFIATLVAYLINSMFHNNTLFISEYAILVFIALLLVLSERRKEN